jgi:hypothetical protein
MDIEVVARVLVPRWAMRLYCMFSRRSDATQYVLPDRHRLEVFRVNTLGIPAQVVEMQAVRNGAHVVLIGPAMSVRLASIFGEFLTPIELPVPHAV